MDSIEKLKAVLKACDGHDVNLVDVDGIKVVFHQKMPKLTELPKPKDDGKRNEKGPPGVYDELFGGSPPDF
jgi:hypothetical protein